MIHPTWIWNLGTLGVSEIATDYHPMQIVIEQDKKMELRGDISHVKKHSVVRVMLTTKSTSYICMLYIIT